MKSLFDKLGRRGRRAASGKGSLKAGRRRDDRKLSFERSSISRMVFESLEQRLLLSDTPLTPPTYNAQITYDASLSTGMDVTLEVISEVINGTDTPVLRLWDNLFSAERGRQILDENIKVTITGSKEDLVTNKSLSDTLRIDLGYSGPAFASYSIMVELDGGDNLPLIVDDTVIVQNSGPDLYLPSSLFIKSTSDVTFNSSVTVNGGLDVQSEELISLTSGVNIAAGSLYFGVSKTVDSGIDIIDGFNILADATAAIDIAGASITANDIGLIVDTNVDIDTQDSAYFDDVVKVAFVQATSDASIDVSGASVLNATGALIARATSTVSSKATTAPDSTSNQSYKDASIASNIVASSARVKIGGTTSVSAGSVTLSALNNADVSADADGTSGSNSGSAVGGTVAITNLAGDTRAELADGASVNAASLSVGAVANRTTHAKAKATQGGASNPGGNSTTGSTTLANNNASTGDGSVGFAAAVAFNHVEGLVLGRVATSGNVTVTSTSALGAPAAAATMAEADGSSTSGSGSAVGVAVAINVADIAARAALGGSGTISAAAVTLQALTTTGTKFGAQSTSGASGSDLGVAGSLAINVGITHTEAIIEAGSSLTVVGGNVTLNADSATHDVAKALPIENATTGESFGMGASVAINVADDTTRAGIDTTALAPIATFSGVGLTLSADSNSDVDTEARGGAEGGTALTPVAAITIASANTRVELEAGSTTTLSGALNGNASHVGDIAAKAEGDAEGSDSAAIGASFVFTKSAPTVEAFLGVNLTATGAATMTARSTGNTRSDAKAAARGASDNGSDADATTASGRSAGDNAAATQGATNSGTSSSPSSETSDGPVTVAAAIVVQISESNARAS